jgi:hypothetical protein
MRETNWNGSEELANALRSCEEIGTTQNLHQFMSGIPQLKQRMQKMNREFPQFPKFLHSVIICTDQKYNPDVIKTVAALPFKKNLNMLEIMKSLLMDLLKAKKLTHLQC